MKNYKTPKFVGHFVDIQGVRKWNVFFENATVAKLLNILTRTDAF